mmetsp:Transcript_35016/g.64855  ORF Transcript_35016/g.64855 Transcript_35016/m.64855 type:complete len:95 (-) Transcript_35016:35-319(-)
MNSERSRYQDTAFCCASREQSHIRAHTHTHTHMEIVGVAARMQCTHVTHNLLLHVPMQEAFQNALGVGSLMRLAVARTFEMISARAQMSKQLGS